MPHSTHDTTFLPPVLGRGNVTVVKPTIAVHILRGVDIDEVVHIHGRPLARPTIDILCLLRIPVHIGHDTRDDLLAIEILQHTEEFLGLLTGISIGDIIFLIITSVGDCFTELLLCIEGCLEEGEVLTTDTHTAILNLLQRSR